MEESSISCLSSSIFSSKICRITPDGIQIDRDGVETNGDRLRDGGKFDSGVSGGKEEGKISPHELKTHSVFLNEDMVRAIGLEQSRLKML